jgi:hypothetical protein
MVVAVLALFVAMGGTVYAASTISGKSVKKNSLPGNRIKKKTVTGNRMKNDTITGTQVNEATLGTVPSATTATTALTANPPAYAHINADGSVDAANSHNVAAGNVSRIDDGVYCISGLSVTPHVILAEVDSKDGPGVTEASVLTSNFIACPSGSNAEIVTYQPDTIEFTDYAGGFYVVIF